MLEYPGRAHNVLLPGRTPAGRVAAQEQLPAAGLTAGPVKPNLCPTNDLR